MSLRRIETNDDMIELSPLKHKGDHSHLLPSVQALSPVLSNTSSINSINSISSTSIDKDDLSELHDPKSIKFFKKRFHNTTSEFYMALDTSPSSGLEPRSDADLLRRAKNFGKNVLPTRKPKSFFRLAWEALQDKVLILLSVAAVVSFALGLYETFGQPQEYDAEGKPVPKVEWVEGVAIIIAVLIVVLVGAANDYQKELQFAKLNAQKSNRDVVVVRGNNEHVISIFDLLVGDVLMLQTGDVLPADAVMVEGSCECDESALTGESQSITKVPIDVALMIYNEKFPNEDADIGTKGVPDPYLISGSKLLSGLGKAVITAVGPNSIHGRTMLALKVEPEHTPLQIRLNALADGITKYGLLAALILFIVLFAKFLSYLPRGHRYFDLTPAQKGSKFLDIVITAITIIVVAVPEGLPLAVTLALAFATTRMAKDGNLVRVLRSCEIMGGATAVCSDKTGTLTENKMKVVNGNLSDMEFDDNATSEIKHSNQLDLTNSVKVDLLSNIALNSTAFENKEAENEQPVLPAKKKHFWSRTPQRPALVTDQIDEPFIGSKTETALLRLALESLGMDNDLELSKLRSNPSLLGIESIVQVIPFESSRKWGGIVVKLKNSPVFRCYVKGAAEIILGNCQFKTLSDGSPTELSSKVEVNEKINDYARLALRTISLAHKDFENLSSWPPNSLKSEKYPADADPELLLSNQSLNFNNENTPNIVINDDEDTPQPGLVLDGIVGIKDPLRQGVKEAVAQCHRAGVTVRMVTGDNITTAKAISVNCGILTEGYEDIKDVCMEGPVFRKLPREEQIRIVPNLRVLARSSPNDKRILVEILKKLGEVVAVTGDGTNDAPALKLADVGFSMGISGTEVAREASDIILMTDDFSAIVNAIKWGRCVSTSIKKFIQFQLTVNITAVILTFVSAVSSSEGKSVLTAVQLLWVNLIMDTLAALALATDKPDSSILDKKPDGRAKNLISVSTWKMIIGQSSLQLTVTFVIHFAGAKIFFPHHTVTDHEQTQLDALTFNTFVWLQFFKLWVTRKLDEADGIKTVRGRITLSNLDFFQHFFRNWYFLIIASIIAGGQILIMFVGGSAFSIARQTGPMWATAVICGMLSLPWGVIIRIIPDEWVVKIFPTRLFKAIIFVISLQFLKPVLCCGGKRQKIRLDDEEETIGLENKKLYKKIPALQKTRDDLEYLKEEQTNNDLNPLHIYQKWRSRSNSTFSSNDSTLDESNSPHTLAALTMVPTVVGGAVAGWSPLGSDSENREARA